MGPNEAKARRELGVDVAAPELKYETKCHHCGVVIKRPPLQPIIDGKVNPAVIEYIVSMYGHLEKRHPEQYAAVNAATQNFMGLATVANFELSDPALLELHEGIRKHVNAFTTVKNEG